MIEKILIKKSPKKKIKYRMCLLFAFEAFQVKWGLFIKYSYNLHNSNNSYGKVNFYSILKRKFFSYI